MVAAGGHDPALLAPGLGDPRELALPHGRAAHLGRVLGAQAQQARPRRGRAHAALEAVGLPVVLVLPCAQKHTVTYHMTIRGILDGEPGGLSEEAQRPVAADLLQTVRQDHLTCSHSTSHFRC